MGRLVDGVWTARSDISHDSKGRFIRSDTQFHDWITADGSSGFPAVAGRYHLYVSSACPWACRTLIFRALKKLDDVVSVTIASPDMGEQGWVFDADPVNGVPALHQLYSKARSDYSGRATVPVLWDRESATIVNNESSEIIRMFNGALAELGDNSHDYYPESLRAEIDEVNELVYESINNGVYRCGFASSQEAYEEAFDALFSALDSLELRLSTRRYLCGDHLTEADWRLFTSLVRFDPVYATHFKCNRQPLVSFSNLWGYTRELYQMPGIADTVDFGHIKRHYYGSHESVNPRRIVAKGPAVDFDAPHGRGA